MILDVHPLEDIEQLSSLVALAYAEGHAMVSRLVAEWKSSVNRFDRSGEVLLVARAAGEIVGVSGLNQDPFVSEGRVGRARRLYVASARHRQGVATALLCELLKRAEPWFDVVHVRTYDTSAVAFYRSLGFVEVIDDPACTHRRGVAA